MHLKIKEKDVETFTSIFEKLTQEASKIGYTKNGRFTSSEQDLIKKIKENI